MSVRRWAITLLCAVGAVAGCSSSGNNASESSTVPSSGPLTTTPATSSPPSSTSASAGVPDLGEPEVIADGLDVPWGLAFLPGGDALFSERDNGKIFRVTSGGGAPKLVYDVPGVASAAGEGGLLGIAVAPTFAKDRLVYAYFTAEQDNRIVRFRLDGGTPQVIFDGIEKSGIHNGGRIAFGPDGMLYVGTGDAGNGTNSQDPQSPNGKILRLTPDGSPAPGNPDAGSPVYSLGHRNVQGIAWDAQGQLFAAEFGQNTFDEVNRIEPGRNYGWPEVEGTGDTQDGRFTNPLVTWATSEASPSGIAIQGNTAFVAALRGQRLWLVTLDGERAGESTAKFEGQYGRLRTVAVAPDGSLWLTTSNTDGRGEPHDGDDRILRFPLS